MITMSKTRKHPQTNNNNKQTNKNASNKTEQTRKHLNRREQDR